MNLTENNPIENHEILTGSCGKLEGNLEDFLIS